MDKRKKIPADIQAFMRELIQESLRDWFKKEDWVRIDSAGNIAGPCGTSKNTKKPDRCLPRAKAQSLTKAERAATARKKKKAGAKGKTVVKNTKKATVKKETKEAPAGHYFTKSGNLVKGRMSKDAKERGARKSDPKDKQRSKVPPVTQYTETASTSNWPKTISSRYSDEYEFRLVKVVPTYKGKPGRAKYEVVDLESGEVKGTQVYGSPDSLKAAAADLIKPQGGRQSSQFETANPQDGKSAPYGSGFKKVTKEDITNLVTGIIHEMKSKLVTLGYDIDIIQDIVDHLANNYKEGRDYKLHIGRGDDLPNAITFPRGEFRDDHDLNDMLNAAQSDEDRYDTYTDDDLNEKKDDRCTRIAKSKYDTWPSAYASGAVVRCRRGEIWKDIKEETIDEMNCQYGKYFCNHDKKYKCRKGPKKSR